jgi:hypothetical protein
MSAETVSANAGYLEVLRMLKPLGIDAAVRAIESQTHETSAAQRQLELSIQQARYDAMHARRQYDAVDPANRLVAGQLERRWNEGLQAVQKIEGEIAALRTCKMWTRGSEGLIGGLAFGFGCIGRRESAGSIIVATRNRKGLAMMRLSRHVPAFGEGFVERGKRNFLGTLVQQACIGFALGLSFCAQISSSRADVTYDFEFNVATTGLNPTSLIFAISITESDFIATTGLLPLSLPVSTPFYTVNNFGTNKGGLFAFSENGGQLTDEIFPLSLSSTTFAFVLSPQLNNYITSPGTFSIAKPNPFPVECLRYFKLTSS